MLSATDVYPAHIDEGNFHQLLLLNEMTKAVQNQDQPLFSIEFQAGGNQDFSGNQASLYDLHSRLCISSGMRAINHYLFCDGENDPLLSPVKRHDWGHPVRKDGTLRKHYARYPRLSRVLQSYGDDLILSQPETVATVGFLLDDFMTEVNNEFTKKNTEFLTHQREQILFDFIARGLALTHRPFNAIDLSSGELDVSRIPLCWVMIERQCNAATQQKLVDYLHQGGKLGLAGRMCTEDFQHEACTILKDAIGIQQIHGGEPFAWGAIRAFQYQDVPASVIESYVGEFDEIFATNDHGEPVGFIQTIGKGKVMLFGATVPANTLDDLDILHQMALKMDCPSLFHLSDWTDVRLSRGDKGSFLFVNNYQDDPVETTIEHGGKLLLGGNPVCLPARRGLILPVDWQYSQGILIHYVTSEITEIIEDSSSLTLKIEQPEFFAELTLTGYGCEGATILHESHSSKRVKVHGREGMIMLRTDGKPA
jgi:beta-galactosidase